MRADEGRLSAGRLLLGSYAALEEALWQELGRVKADGGPLAPATVVAPSGRLVRHLKRTAALRFPDGLLAVRFANLFQLALDLAGDAAARLVPDPILHERLLLAWLESLPPDDESFPNPDVRTYDFAGALHAAVRDLKDGGVGADPDLVLEALRAAAGGSTTRLTGLDIGKLGGLLRAYRHHQQRLDRLGIVDRSDVFRLAAERPRAGAGPLFVHGFYDMTQVQADLIAALARESPVTLLVPYGDDPGTWRFGDWLRTTLAPRLARSTERLAPGPPPLAPELHSAAGERDEVWFCAKAIRALLDQGACAPEEIAVVARTLDPYLVPLAELFTEHHIPFEAPAHRALLDHPLGQVIRLLFGAVEDGFPRAAVLDVVRHPLFRAAAQRRDWDLLARALRIGRGDDWDRLDRYAGTGHRIVVGREDDEARREVPVPPDAVRGLRTAVRRLRRTPWPAAATWEGHVAAHREALRRCFRLEALLDDERLVLATIDDVLASLARLGVLGETVPRRAFVEAFERECRRRRLPAAPAAGVAVLDAMAARGLPFRHVFLLGLNARTFPRFIVEEPFVSDPVRREVLRVLGHHLPVRLDAYDEERLLFHLVHAAARERCVMLYQRADAEGRLRDPSPFLRPFLPLDRDAIDAVPRSEQAKRARDVVRTPRELLLGAADVGRALAAFGLDALAWTRARAVLDALDGTREVGPFEGRIGALDPARAAALAGRLSPTRVERFAACPFRYFAGDVLKLVPYEAKPAGEDLTPLEIGNLMHDVLERLYRTLSVAECRADGLDAALAGAVAAASAAFERREGVALRGVLAARVAEIRRAVAAFAAWDLAHLGGWVPTWFEAKARVELAGVGIGGTMDRIDRERTSGALRVIDYKRRWTERWKPPLAGQARRARKLQGPFYLALAPEVARSGGAPPAAVEVRFHFVESYAREDLALDDHLVRTFSAADADACRDQVAHALETFAALLRDGWFFIRPEDREYGHCGRCDYRSVCRKNYGRLRRKPEDAPELAPYWAIVG